MNLKQIINKGLITIYLPLILFVLICGYSTHWVTLKLDNTDIIVTISVMIAICIGWVWWSYKIVKWKCWAFSQLNLEDSCDLYIKAIEIGLIWPTGSIFNKTEIWTKKDKYNWSQIDSEIRSLFELDG